ncbi:MAG TPA: PIG-L family deacetylase [Candidatus Eisenbacteria bacterium]|nr:PIG-L family deacetylase [Candidatus Eisenbacteria bacterium]
MTDALRLLALLAHPDDESLGVGGILAAYAAEGMETYVLTATRGQAGRYRGVREGEGPEHPGRDALAAIRERELRAAADVLGVRGLTLLGYDDGRLDQADPAEVLRRVAEEIRRVRPHVAVTFGPDGGYGHPDHIAISQFAAAGIVAAADPAFQAGGRPPHAVSKFYFMASPASEWAAYQEAFKKLTSVVDGVERQADPWPDWAITTIVDTSAHWPTIWKAVSCHESQVAGYERLRHLSPEHHAALWGTQHFYRVFSTVNGGRRRETDLFEGLRP